MNDEELMEIYMKGFNDEFDGLSENVYSPDTLEFKAYAMGGVDAVIGDDCPSLDYRAAKEILDMIKN